jgi:hypothetical protein
MMNPDLKPQVGAGMIEPAGTKQDEGDMPFGDGGGISAVTRIYNPFADAEFLQSDVDHGNRRLDRDLQSFLP